MNALRSAFSYFSILPAGTAEAPGAAALAWLPLVGVVIGALAGALGWLTSLVASRDVAVAVAFGAGIALSGAIHLDGYLDSCDALFASVEPQRRFEILKDPRHGTFALAGLAIAVPLWIAAIAAVPAASWPWTFAFAAGVARAAAVCNAFRVPYAPGGASAKAFEARPNIIAVAFGVAVAAACCFPHLLLALLVLPAVALALALGAWCARRLDGVLVGDCYGAIVLVVEVILVATIASVI